MSVSLLIDVYQRVVALSQSNVQVQVVGEFEAPVELSVTDIAILNALTNVALGVALFYHYWATLVRQVIIRRHWKNL